jgi:NAD-dependent SIR2 family protein deacetylase
LFAKNKKSAISPSPHVLHSVKRVERMEALVRIAQSLRDNPKTRILVAAGAGLSVPAGIDYNDTVSFAQRYPGMVDLGFGCAYQLIGHPALRADPALMWGYYGEHAHWMRFELGANEMYSTLREVVGQHDYYVWTTNVDGMFEKNGFDADRIYTMQGDFQSLQCLKPCRQDAVWESRPVLEQIVKHTDHRTQRLQDLSLVPKCPYCDGPAMLNVRGGSWFLEDHLVPMRHRVEAWMRDAVQQGDPVLILEIGAGFNTPGCIRIVRPRSDLARGFRSLLTC